MLLLRTELVAEEAMKLLSLSKGSVFFAVMTIVFLISAFPTVTISNYEVENCAMWCREVFDQVKDPTSYSTCVEECKRRLSNKPLL